MDLKLVYWHIKDVSFTASICKGSLRVLHFKSHWAESTTPPALWGTAFYLQEGALGGFLCPLNSSAERWEQTLYSWPALLRSLKISTVEKRQILQSLGFATEGRAVYAFLSIGRSWWLWMTSTFLLFLPICITQQKNIRFTYSHVPGQTPTCRAKGALMTPLDAPDPSSLLQCPFSLSLLPRLVGRHPGAVWNPEPIFCFPSPHSCHHGKMGTLQESSLVNLHLKPIKSPSLALWKCPAGCL